MSSIAMKTKEVLLEMLKENTGRALCDSGGQPQYDVVGEYIRSSQGYGRNYERNAGLTLEALEKIPASTVTLDGEHLSVEHNVFHYLAWHLEIDEERDAAWLAFCDLEENANTSYFELVELYIDHMKESGIEPKGFYGEGEPITENTYNVECLLSQTIQFTYWTEGDDADAFVLVSTHNGADVRGGYSKPRLFRVTSDDTSFFDWARATINCSSECKADATTLFGVEDAFAAYTDDGHNWYDSVRSNRLVFEVQEASDDLAAKATKEFNTLFALMSRQQDLFGATAGDINHQIVTAACEAQSSCDPDSDDFVLWRLVMNLAQPHVLVLRKRDDRTVCCPQCKAGVLDSHFH